MSQNSCTKESDVASLHVVTASPVHSSTSTPGNHYPWIQPLVIGEGALDISVFSNPMALAEEYENRRTGTKLNLHAKRIRVPIEGYKFEDKDYEKVESDDGLHSAIAIAHVLQVHGKKILTLFKGRNRLRGTPSDANYVTKLNYTLGTIMLISAYQKCTSDEYRNMLFQDLTNQATEYRCLFFTEDLNNIVLYLTTSCKENLPTEVVQFAKKYRVDLCQDIEEQMQRLQSILRANIPENVLNALCAFVRPDICTVVAQLLDIWSTQGHEFYIQLAEKAYFFTGKVTSGQSVYINGIFDKDINDDKDFPPLFQFILQFAVGGWTKNWTWKYSKKPVAYDKIVVKRRKTSKRKSPQRTSGSAVVTPFTKQSRRCLAQISPDQEMEKQTEQMVGGSVQRQLQFSSDGNKANDQKTESPKNMDDDQVNDNEQENDNFGEDGDYENKGEDARNVGLDEGEMDLSDHGSEDDCSRNESDHKSTQESEDEAANDNDNTWKSEDEDANDNGNAQESEDEDANDHGNTQESEDEDVDDNESVQESEDEDVDDNESAQESEDEDANDNESAQESEDEETNDNEGAQESEDEDVDDNESTQESEDEDANDNESAQESEDEDANDNESVQESEDEETNDNESVQESEDEDANDNGNTWESEDVDANDNGNTQESEDVDANDNGNTQESEDVNSNDLVDLNHIRLIKEILESGIKSESPNLQLNLPSIRSSWSNINENSSPKLDLSSPRDTSPNATLTLPLKMAKELLLCSMGTRNTLESSLSPLATKNSPTNETDWGVRTTIPIRDLKSPQNGLYDITNYKSKTPRRSDSINSDCSQMFLHNSPTSPFEVYPSQVISPSSLDQDPFSRKKASTHFNSTQQSLRKHVEKKEVDLSYSPAFLEFAEFSKEKDLSVFGPNYPMDLPPKNEASSNSSDMLVFDPNDLMDDLPALNSEIPGLNDISAHSNISELDLEGHDNILFNSGFISDEIV